MHMRFTVLRCFYSEGGRTWLVYFLMWIRIRIRSIPNDQNCIWLNVTWIIELCRVKTKISLDTGVIWRPTLAS
jgi:hypothetical protein